MIVSVNPDPHRDEFNLLLSNTINELNGRVAKNSKTIAKLLGRDLEPYVKDALSEFAVGTPFESSIELIGGQRFPDIIAKKYYGIEVKTTSQNHWKTTGNSVLETTRVNDIERIFMLFAKMAAPIEFRCRPYEEVLSEVVVTHSPRYLIDMNLSEGKTIFDKIDMPYDVLRKKDNPIKPIVDYYKGLLKPGEELWWMDANNDSKANNMVIRIWGNLSTSEKNYLRDKAMVYFPELFSSSSTKFGRIAIWLTTREAVVCPNIRDLFTAGGKSDYSIGGEVHHNVPRVLFNLFSKIPLILAIINDTPAYELSEYWDIQSSEKTKISDWIELVTESTSSIFAAKHIPVKDILEKLIAKNL